MVSRGFSMGKIEWFFEDYIEQDLLKLSKDNNIIEMQLSKLIGTICYCFGFVAVGSVKC